MPNRDNTTVIGPAESDRPHKFPYVVVVIVLVWALLILAYFISRWRQRAKVTYIIPRVFVLCSPRTVQFHYELILRVGLPSYDFNPEKHDIDITVQGQQKNEVVPMTRLNTKTLLDEPLITSLSLVVYRLVEMPPLGGLILRHSGPFKAWVYAYDFTVIDLATNKEQYFILNSYIGSLNRTYTLDDSSKAHTSGQVQFPIDDVPLPQWTTEDIFLFLYTVLNSIMLVMTLMPINCAYLHDILAIFLTALGGGSLVFFLEWLLYYQLRWNQDRKEYFNEYETCWFCPNETISRALIGLWATFVGGFSIYFAVFINDWRDSIVWLLATINSCTLVIGFWNVARQTDFGESIMALGVRLRGIQPASVGMRYSEMVSDIQSKSGSASDEGLSATSATGVDGSGSSGRLAAQRSFGPRSSVKSFGFNLLSGHSGRKTLLTPGGRFSHAGSRISGTGATPENQPTSQFLHGPGYHLGHHPQAVAAKHQLAAATAAAAAAAAADASRKHIQSPAASLGRGPLTSHSSAGSTISSTAIAPSSRSHSDSDKHKPAAKTPA